MSRESLHAPRAGQVLICEAYFIYARISIRWALTYSFSSIPITPGEDLVVLILTERHSMKMPLDMLQSRYSPLQSYSPQNPQPS